MCAGQCRLEGGLNRVSRNRQGCLGVSPERGCNIYQIGTSLAWDREGQLLSACKVYSFSFALASCSAPFFLPVDTNLAFILNLAHLDRVT